jgi:DNA-directed RNA polymerase specialized sigma24 family protein
VYRHQLIEKIISNSNYKRICVSISRDFADDLFQEVCEQILTIKEERLPSEQHLPIWFYCVAKNTISKNGKIGKLFSKEYDIPIEKLHLIEIETTETDSLNTVEDIMLSMSEFENRITILYTKLGNMKKVQKETGISYSALRSVKEKLKNIR